MAVETPSALSPAVRQQVSVKSHVSINKQCAKSHPIDAQNVAVTSIKTFVYLVPYSH